MKKNLKQSVKEHFSSVTLAPEDIERLKTLQYASVEEQGNRHRPLRVLASLILGLLFIPVGYFAYQSLRPSLTLNEVAQDIAYHHNKRMSLEVESSSLTEVRTFFSKLDFSLIQSERLPEPEWKLLGGRYCTVKGVLSAQLRIKDLRTDKVYTYYQAAFPDNLGNPNELFQTYEGGTHVQLWRERGLLLALAGDD